MLSSNCPNTIHIHITTYPNTKVSSVLQTAKMEKQSADEPRFICTVCLNNRRHLKPDAEKLKTKACPGCQKQKDDCKYPNLRMSDVDTVNIAANKCRKYSMTKAFTADDNNKTVQTSQTNIVEGLNLLNEVLKVFKDRRDVEVHKSDESMKSCKDVGVSTEAVNLPKLTISTTCNISIENELLQSREKTKFVVLHSRQPTVWNSKHAICLSKHKSSSIPQMKLEVLKHSLKQKTTSKDAVEEVNRMFATVRRKEDDFDTINRPMTRSGPRMLPVVRTKPSKVNEEKKCPVLCQCNVEQNVSPSGDALYLEDKCHKGGKLNTLRCDKCVYTICHKYDNHSEPSTLLCVQCRCRVEEGKCRRRHDINQSGDT